MQMKCFTSWRFCSLLGLLGLLGFWKLKNPRAAGQSASFFRSPTKRNSKKNMVVSCCSVQEKPRKYFLRNLMDWISLVWMRGGIVISCRFESCCAYVERWSEMTPAYIRYKLPKSTIYTLASNTVLILGGPVGQTGPNKMRSSFSWQKMGRVPLVCHNFGRKNIITWPVIVCWIRDSCSSKSVILWWHLTWHIMLFPDTDPFLQLDGLIEKQTSHTFTFSFWASMDIYAMQSNLAFSKATKRTSSVKETRFGQELMVCICEFEKRFKTLR